MQFIRALRIQIEADKDGINEHGIQHRRGLTCPTVTPIPDLRPGLDSPTSSPSNKPPFQGPENLTNFFVIFVFFAHFFLQLNFICLF